MKIGANFGVGRKMGVFGGRHTDKAFPPRAKSIGKWRNYTEDEIEKQANWVRASEWYQQRHSRHERANRVQLFDSASIDPRQIAQGSVGDCWLIAAFACVVAHDPQIVQAAFVDGKATSRCKYRVRLFDRQAEEWRIIVIDDHIPIDSRTHQPIFAQSTGAAMWVSLLEKAFAKYVGSYAALDGGSIAFALNALTGDPVFRMKRYDFAAGAWRRLDVTVRSDKLGKKQMGFRPSDEAHDSDGTFLMLCGYCRRRALIGASFGQKKQLDPSSGALLPHGWSAVLDPESGDYYYIHPATSTSQWEPPEDTVVSSASGMNGEELLACGLVGGHAYSILDAKLLRLLDGSARQLLRLRNAWGDQHHAQWTGAWGFGAAEWAMEEHRWVYDLLRPDELNDGSFWMSWQDFSVVFDKLDFCSNILRPSDRFPRLPRAEYDSPHEAFARSFSSMNSPYEVKVEVDIGDCD